MQTNPNQNPNNPVPNTPNPNQNPNPSNPPPNNPNPNGGDENQRPQISLEDMLAGIGQQLGGAPKDNPNFSEADPVQMQMLEDNYAMKVERAFDKMQKEVKNKIEDATDAQIHEIGMAFMNGDIGAGIDAIQHALRHSEEVNDKDQDQVNLHVEGGSGGKQGGDDGKNEGLSGVLKNIANTYGQRANA